MFDLAIRPQASTSPSRLLTLPFDLRLAQPGATRAFPWTAYVTATGAPVAQADQLAVYSVELEDTLNTAIIISLFTDRRAGPDDALPLGQQDRRGWVGDEFMADDSGAIGAWGSGLWTCLIGKVTSDVLERARFAAQEALAWLIADGIASRVEVTAEWVGDRLAVRPTIFKTGQTSPVYDVLWDTSIRRGALQ